MQIFDDSKQKAWRIGNIDRELLIKRWEDSTYVNIISTLYLKWDKIALLNKTVSL